MRAPSTARAGLIGSHSGSALPQAASHFGIDLEVGSGAEMLSRAAGDRWPLLTVLPASRVTMEAAGVIQYLRTGGTIFIPQLTAEDDDWLQALSARTQIAMPRCRALSQPATRIFFSSSRPDIAAELSGLVVDNREGSCFLDACVGAEPLLLLRIGADSVNAMVEVPAHGGRLILAVGAPIPSGSLHELYQPEQALSVLPAMLLIRAVYGEAAWHAPFAMANFTIDDPMLREGLLGLDYRRALAAAQQDDFHLTVATVPRELPLADPATVRLLADNHDRVTACYHGNDHDGYEFFVAEGAAGRFRSRSLPSQLAALRGAAARGTAFARRAGHALDRVMVFPHGLGPAAILGELGKLGFMASSNWLDRYPLAAPPPDEPGLGMRPADVAWDGFPLLWRRPLEDETFAFDLLIGRPVLYFTHRRQAGVDCEPLRELAGRISDVALGRVRWRGLEEVARHAYLQRRKAAGNSWDVLMTANTACLHNSGQDTRRYRVCRPHLDPTAHLCGPGGRSAGPVIEIDVAPGQTVEVRVMRPDGGELPDPFAGRHCPLTDEGDS